VIHVSPFAYKLLIERATETTRESGPRPIQSSSIVHLSRVAAFHGNENICRSAGRRGGRGRDGGDGGEERKINYVGGGGCHGKIRSRESSRLRALRGRACFSPSAFPPAGHVSRAVKSKGRAMLANSHAWPLKMYVISRAYNLSEKRASARPG